MQRHFSAPISLALLALILVLSGPGCSAPPNSAAPSNQPAVGFIALQPKVSLFSGGDSGADVAPNQTVNIRVGDRIEADKEGRGILSFPGLLDVEVFRNTALLIDDATQESGGSTSVKLRQIHGHTAVSLHGEPGVRVTLVTEIATVTSLQQGTEFLVCQAPGVLTCIDVLKGAVDVTAQGERQTVRAGEATYVLKDQPPKPAICAPVDEFIAWKDEMRNSADTPAVGDLVAELPQRPCSDGTSQTAGLPGSEGMVKIRYGTYQIGRAQPDEFHSALREIPLDNFWIDKYEVTNAQYQEYLNQAGGQAPVVPLGQPEYPVRGVTWDQAAAYCSWAGKRLPTEDEWEVAGRGPGPNATRFPWGDDPDAGGQISALPLDTPYPVGSYSFNVSSFGAYDMVGNVWQWVAKPYDTVPEGYKILRGGQFGWVVDLAYRQPAKPDDANFLPVAGFRCAADQVKE